MVFRNRRFVSINLIMLFMIFHSNCSDTSETAEVIDSRLAGWEITSKFVPSQALIQSIEGSYKIIKYWEIIYGGSDSLKYSLIRTPDSLDSYWKNLMLHVKLDKPAVDFTKNILLVIQPGAGRNGFKYRIAIEEKQDLIELTVSNYLVGVLSRLSIGCNPIFAFEIPASPLSKEVKVHFNIDSRSYGIHPK